MNSRSKYSKALNLIKSNRVISRLFSPEAHERTATTRSNVIFSSLYKGISILLSLWLVPLTLHYLNPTKYGIWLTLTSIIAWFGFFDVGLGNGLRNKLAEARAKKDYSLARTYVSTTYAIITSIAIVLTIVFFFA